MRTLYLECNAIDTIEGLEKLIDLRCLYLGQNMISCISGLESLRLLENLDLSQNDICTVENLACLPRLRTLNLSGNKIRSRANVENLAACPSLTSLDLATNRIDDVEAVEVLKPLSNLSLLRLVGNPVVSSIKHYRKVLLAAMPGLKYLDESPVFDKDRRLAVAFVSGGVKAEREERDLVRQEEAETRERHRRNFDLMVANAKEKAATHPPPPHDPMRFRAVPPGDSDSEDDSDLPLSCRISRKSRGLKGKLATEAPGSEAAAGLEGATHCDDDGLPALEGMECVDQGGAADASSEGSSEDFLMVHQAEEVVATLVDIGAPAASSSPPTALRSDILAELRKRVPLDVSGGVAPGEGEEEQGSRRRRRGRGEAPPKRGPSVWGTERYRHLWQMACEVGKLQEEQHQQQQLDQEDDGAGDEAEGEEWLHVEEAPSLSLEECANEEEEAKCSVGL